MLLEIDGNTVIEKCMNAFYASCSKIIVVTGQYHEDIKCCMAPYSKVHIVYNRDYGKGMFSSVKAGVKHVEAERFFLTPGDYPFLQAKTIQRMANAEGYFVVPVYKGEGGHPILLDKLLVPAILHSPCLSLRDCLEGMPVKREEIHVDDRGVITDLDTMEAYKAAIAGC